MNTRACTILIAILASAGIVLSLSSEAAFAAAYSPCRVPPVVSVGNKPNVMLVMDFSGSMQFPAYFDENFGGYYSSKVADCYNTSTSQIYLPANQYYGTFEPDTYYVYDSTNDYFVPANPQPVLYYQGTADSADGGAGTIEFTCDGHNFLVGDLVALYDLSSHKSLNGKGYQVAAVNGNKFKINATWNGKPDAKGYRAIKRISGNTAIGISGNILNLAITSRTDAALKALIGGKALCPSGDSYCYVQSQGARRYVSESTNVFANFYVRPATLQSPAQAYPDDYSDGSYTDKDIFVTISGEYSGTIDANDPVIPTSGGQYSEPWTFTLSRTTKVIIKLVGTWASSRGSRIAVSTASNFSVVTKEFTSSTTTTTFSWDLPAGTYYVRMAPNTQLSATEVPKTYTVLSNVELTKYTALHTNPANHNGTVTTKIGSLPWGRVRIKIPMNDRKGLVQRAFQYVRFGFMYFKSDATANYGKILVGCDNQDMNRLVNALQGRDTDASDGLDFTQVFPYYGTPTGPALREAYDYFAQVNKYANADNSAFVSTSTKGTLKDPYYSLDAYGVARPVPCRKSFVVLISDGEWNVGVDPVKPALEMHQADIRSDVTGVQTVDAYSIFAFSQEVGGKNAMKAIAMYGAFKDVSGCDADNLPYTGTNPNDTGFNSLTFSWPRSNCDPAGTYNTACCAEWDSIWDRDGDGTNEQKGIPDTYFGADNGKELQEALEAVLGEVISRTASASAVATVSQELSTGDIIIRGVFDAADPEVVDKYPWYGHLEAYWPFKHEGEERYDFEIPCNQGFICLDMPGIGSGCPSTAHCWDSGLKMSTDQAYTGTGVPPRTIFTYKNKTKTTFEWTGPTGSITKTDLNVSTDLDAENLIKWVFGAEITDLRDRDFSKLKGKQWLLGDIVYSTPVVVGPPRLGDVSIRDPDLDRFLTYRNTKISREKVIYVGGNDGMLHAFLLAKYRTVTKADGTTETKWVTDPSEDPDTTGAKLGQELWAYIPSNLLTELKNLADANYGIGTCKHRTMVDLSPRAWEVFIKSANCPPHTLNSAVTDDKGRCWRSVLVGGERGGGDLYFAIDVTDPQNPSILWEYSVFKNRVVVASQTTISLDNNCYLACKSACRPTPAECDTNYNTCVAGCPARPARVRNNCLTGCTNTKNTCLSNYTVCDNGCINTCTITTTNYKAFEPFSSSARYEAIKIIPMGWSQPYLGRVKMPTGVKFYVGSPTNAGDLITGGLPQNLVQFDPTGTADIPTGSTSPFTATLENKRSVAFMGGGIRVFDQNFDVPGITSSDPFKTALFKPFVIMMDIETGYNLFEYVWPWVVINNAAVFPPVTTATTSVPYAPADPLALDVWNQDTDTVGDDGFIDRIYLGDLNGYFYGIKFNLDPIVKSPTGTLVANSNFGIRVDLWPTKPIGSGDFPSDDYRGNRQPITVQPVATFEKNSDAIHVIFGTGKYDDVFSGTDDKTDSAKMALYNVRDVVDLPDLRSGAYEVFDSTQPTGFKVKLQQNCPGVTFNSGCTWYKQGTSPPDGDCCQFGNSTCVNPCYDCIYDLTLPTSGTTGGERIVGKPLIAGSLVFFTSYVPPVDVCDYAGQGYLYVFEAGCSWLFDADVIFPRATGAGVVFLGFGSGDNRVDFGIRLSLGSGMPSRPVLDSRGENIIVQMSDGTLKRTAVKLPGKPVQVKGWRATR